MRFFDKINIKTAVEKQHTFPFEACHDTSAEFGQFNIAQKKWLCPGKGKVSMYTFSNMQPMPQPTFGKVTYRNRIFFVPFRTIMKGFDDSLMDNMHTTSNNTSGMIATLRYIKLKTLTETMCDLMTPVAQATAQYTFVIGGTNNYRSHNSLSKWAMKFLNGLGYRILFSNNTTYSVNCMNILAAAKIYMDYYYNNAYINDTDYITLKQILERDNGDQELKTQDLKAILNTINHIFYKDDYFVSAWENPNHPNLANQESTFLFQDPNGSISTDLDAQTNWISNTDNNGYTDPFISGSDGTNSSAKITPTQWAINTLRALTMYLKRHQLAGGDTMARYLARFGIELYSEKDKKAQYLGEIRWGMNVSPIFANADTAADGGVQLGSYAGSAYAESPKGNNQKWFNVETKEWGVLMAINTIVPHINYVQGFDHENLHMTKTDLWTPEFDNIGVDAIAKAELVMPETGSQTTDTQNMFTQVFGLLPRYASHKTMRDQMSGNYCDPLYMARFEPYTLQRKIQTNLALTNYVHSKDFTLMQDADQYDRIYYVQSNDKMPYDNINLHHEIQIIWTCGMKPMYDYYDWEHEGGREIEFTNNGAIMQ